MFDLKIIVLIFLTVFCLKAQHNYNYENFGNKSILLNGNVTGSVTDLGASYYNPARLTTLGNSLLEINAKVYQLQKAKLDNIFGRSSELDDTNFGSIPRMLAGAFTIKGIEKNIFAYTFLTKKSGSFSTYHEIEMVDYPTPNNSTVNSLRLENDIVEEWSGLSWARNIGQQWSIGATIFYSYYNNGGKATIRNISLYNGSEVSFYEKIVGFRIKSYGLYPVLGIAYANNKATFGLNISFPHIELNGKGSMRYEEYLAGSMDEGDRFAFNNFQNLESQHKYPLGIQVGAGIPWNKSILHAKVSWYSSLKSYSLITIPEIESRTDAITTPRFDEKFKSVLNFGLGWEQTFFENLKGYASFSTDFSPFEYRSSLFELIGNGGDIMGTNANYYHFGAGSGLKIKGIGLSVGAVYSRGKSKFSAPVDSLTILGEESFGNTQLVISRWRFLFGLDITLFKDKITEISE